MPKLDADHYEKNSSKQNALAQEILTYHHFSPAERILDVGCGDGKITAQLAKVCPDGKAHGIDPSESMIGHAVKTHTDGNLSFAIGSAEDDHGLNQYSLITALSCMHWVKDHLLAFQNAYSALKPGGKFLILTFPKESIYWQLFVEVMQDKQFAMYHNQSIVPFMKSNEALQNIAKDAGFNIINWDVIQVHALYQSPQDFKDYVNGWLGCVFDAPKSVHDEYLDAVTELAVQQYSKNDGLVIPYTKLHIYLEKLK